MTDFRLSRTNRPMAERLLKWITEDCRRYWRIFVGVTPEDGLGQTWLPRAVEPWLRILRRIPGIEVHLGPGAAAQLNRQCP